MFVTDEKQKEHSSSHHATEWKDNPRDDEDWIDEDVDDYDDDYDDYYDYEWDMNERTGSVSFCKVCDILFIFPNVFILFFLALLNESGTSTSVTVLCSVINAKPFDSGDK